MPHRVPTWKGKYSFENALVAAKVDIPNNDEFSFDLNELRLIRDWYYISSCLQFSLESRELIAKIERIINKINKQIKEAIR